MSVTVNKLDTTDEFTDSSEFDIETLDDITQKGGASNNNNKPGLSVPSNSPSPSNMPAGNNNIPIASGNNKPGTNNMPSGNNNNIPMASGNNKPPSTNNLNKMPSTNNLNKQESTGTNTNNMPSTTADDEPVTMPEEVPIDEPAVINNVPKTKKATPAGGKKGKKKAGLTKKKKVVAGDMATEPLNNDVKPQVEIGNDRGTMTIKYASSKTMTPLYSTGKSNHMDLTPIRDAFLTSYNTVSNMSQDELMALRREMLNTEFSELGADSLIHGLLHLLDDHDTKKLTLRMMLARGELKIGA